MLSIKSLTKSFGGIKALKGIDIEVKEGDIHGIIGPNGSGKTTTFNCITGLLTPDTGTISLEGTDLVGLKPHEIANKGIRRTFQAGKLVPGLTVLENVMNGVFDFTRKDAFVTFFPFDGKKKEKQIRQRAFETLEMLNLQDSANRWASDLVWAERQFVQVGRAIISKPKLLLLDEPNSGMGAKETEMIEEIIRKVRVSGVTIIVISHDVKMLMNLSDWVSVINFGEKISEGGPEEVQNDPKVLEAYLGAE